MRTKERGREAREVGGSQGREQNRRGEKMEKGRSRRRRNGEMEEKDDEGTRDGG